jgi:hypothetical protein
LPSCILICNSQTLARLKCRLFASDWHAPKAAADSFDWSPSHQMNACVSKRSFTHPDPARTHPAAANRNLAPLPTLPHAHPRTAAKIDLAGQYFLRSVRAWQRGKQGAAPSAHSVVHLRRLRFRRVYSRGKCSTAANPRPTRARQPIAATRDTRKALLRAITGD